jgi:hypothetical protein
MNEANWLKLLPRTVTLRIYFRTNFQLNPFSLSKVLRKILPVSLLFYEIKIATKNIYSAKLKYLKSASKIITHFSKKQRRIQKISEGTAVAGSPNSWIRQ